MLLSDQQITFLEKVMILAVFCVPQIHMLTSYFQIPNNVILFGSKVSVDVII